MPVSPVPTYFSSTCILHLHLEQVRLDSCDILSQLSATSDAAKHRRSKFELCLGSVLHERETSSLQEKLMLAALDSQSQHFTGILSLLCPVQSAFPNSRRRLWLHLD